VQQKLQKRIQQKRQADRIKHRQQLVLSIVAARLRVEARRDKDRYADEQQGGYIADPKTSKRIQQFLGMGSVPHENHLEKPHHQRYENSRA